MITAASLLISMIMEGEGEQAVVGKNMSVQVSFSPDHWVGVC